MPVLRLSAASDHWAFSRAVSRSLPISFLSLSFSASSKASCRRLFSHQEEKLPFWMSIFPPVGVQVVGGLVDEGKAVFPQEQQGQQELGLLPVG